MTAQELQALLQSAHPPRLLHLLPGEIDGATRIPGTDGTPNHLLRGTFTLRGISRPLEFPVPPRRTTANTSPARASSNSTAPPTAEKPQF